MTTQIEILAAQTAARAGFGRRKMMQLAAEVARRPVKELTEMSDVEVERYMLVLEVLATPNVNVEEWKELRRGLERAKANRPKLALLI